MHLVVEVVEHAGDAPPLGVLAVALGVGAHRGLDGPGVLAQAIALGELREERPGLRAGQSPVSSGACSPSWSDGLAQPVEVGFQALDAVDQLLDRPAHRVGQVGLVEVDARSPAARRE